MSGVASSGGAGGYEPVPETLGDSALSPEQQEIDDFLEKCGITPGHGPIHGKQSPGSKTGSYGLTPMEQIMLMFMMNNYKLAQVSGQAAIQGHLNNYYTQVQALFTDFEQGAPGSGGNVANATADFKSQLSALMATYGYSFNSSGAPTKDPTSSADPFFTTGPGKSMALSLATELNNMNNQLNAVPASSNYSPGPPVVGYPAGSLAGLWPDTTATPVANFAPYNQMNQSLGTVSGQMTGLSGTVQATTSELSSEQGTVQQVLTSAIKSARDLYLYFAQQIAQSRS